MSERTVSLTPGKRVLFLTKDPELIRRQLRGELDLRMEDLRVEDLMDDINTDAMTPAWACFDYRPEDIARNAYAGHHRGQGAPLPGGRRSWRATSRSSSPATARASAPRRETAVQAEKWSGIRIAIAASFAPIHARNNISAGRAHGRPRDPDAAAGAARSVPLAEFTKGHDPITRKVIEHGGLFPFTKAYARGEVAPAPSRPRPAGR